ncbi:hypothetical protein chiPu_0012184 [Chiloscyllium punctatum]|uniref:Ig-like domain-containing protein n=1 Tax=Chiloscyllium punctatum TaxID=137246 RepID=A0A401STI4_CHIPU|nr:hypothetical protein [Chiloscyllium punctatum]
MFWYRQYPGKELQLMFYSAAAGNVNEEGAADGFTSTRPSGSNFKLESRNLCEVADYPTDFRCLSQFAEQGVKLQCHVEGASTPRMFWYRQDPGKGLQLMFYCYHQSSRSRGVGGRVHRQATE